MSYRIITVWTFRYPTRWALPTTSPNMLYEFKNDHIESRVTTSCIIPTNSGLKLVCF